MFKFFGAQSLTFNNFKNHFKKAMNSKERTTLNIQARKKANPVPQFPSRQAQNFQTQAVSKPVAEITDKAVRVLKTTKPDSNSKTQKSDRNSRGFPAAKPTYHIEKPSSASNTNGGSALTTVQSNVLNNLKNVTKLNQIILDHHENFESDEYENDFNSQNKRWSDFPMRDITLKNQGLFLTLLST